MATNCDFSRSSLIAEQYQREMEMITIALQEESLEEREERLNLVACAWSLTAVCFHRMHVEAGDTPVYVPVAFAHQ